MGIIALGARLPCSRPIVGVASLILGLFVSPLSAVAAATIIVGAGGRTPGGFALSGGAGVAALGPAALAILAALSALAIGQLERRRALDQFRQAVNVMPEGLTVWDASDRLVAWNDRLADVTEFDASKLRIGMPAEEYLRLIAANDASVEPGDLDAWVRARKTARRGPAAVLERKTQSGRWLRIEHRPTAKGGLVSVSVDVTAFKRDAEVLLQAREQAEAANRAKSAFLANMSHEIRTPLTCILGFAGLLDKIDGLPEDARTYVNRIVTGGQALSTIVNDVLISAKLDAGKIELAPQPFDLKRFLDETLGLVVAVAENKGLSLRLEPRGVLPVAVSADKDRLRQILLNLLGNAVKFTEAGSVTLAVERPSGDLLRFEVTDTGPGISQEDASRLFQRFSQVDGSNTRQHGGSGLGLAISKGLVELMGGAIGLRSAEGFGSTFWFTIEAPAADLDGEGKAAERADQALAPLKILIVDDVAVNRELVAAMLAPFEVQLTEAGNGLEAVDAAVQESYDLILMDIQMPGMDGLSATRAIRATSALNRETPIVALSANVLPSEIEAGRQAGLCDHIGKPINPGELLSKIAMWTSGQ